MKRLSYEEVDQLRIVSYNHPVERIWEGMWVLEINRKKNRNAWAVPETAEMFLQKGQLTGHGDLPAALSVDLCFRR